MDEKNYIKDELDGIAPDLNRIPKKDPFQVPDGYFDRLPMQVQQKIEAAQKRKERTPWGYIFTPKLIPAYAVVLVAVLAGVFFFTNKNENMDTSFSQAIEDSIFSDTELASTDDAADSVLIDQVNIEEDLIVDAYLEQSAPVATAKEEKASDNEEELEQYILENVSETLIMEEL